MSRRLAVRLLAALLVVTTAAGCASLPVAGPVRSLPADPTGELPEAPYFNPPGPAVDGSPAAIVSGFLVAQQANPLSTRVAREFLSEQGRSTWKPNRGTIVYDSFTVQPTSAGATVRLVEPRRLDQRGGWRGGTPGSSESLELELTSEGGQWRIVNPVNALVVPASFFERTFSRFNLYYFDQTGRVLLPDAVFIPRGDQTASALVRGLLAGPGPAVAGVTGTAFPPGTALDLGVVVDEGGVASVPLSREVLRAPPSELARAADQVAWTLRQVPGIIRVRLTVGDTPVPLPGGRTDLPVSSGSSFDPARSADDPVFWGIRGGRVVDLGSADATVPGPFGQDGYVLRSLAVSEVPRRIAGVSGNGTSVFVAGAGDDVPATAPVDRVFASGTDVLRPSYDMFGDLWFVDRTLGGARVHVVRAGQAREVQVPGVTGADVVALSAARDGSRLAVALADSPSVRVVEVLRTEEGAVSGVGGVRSVQGGGLESGRLVDVGWRDPGTLAVLSRSTAESSQVTFLAADGSPVSRTLVEPTDFRGPARALVVAPDGDLTLRLVTTDERLHALSTSGQWPRTTTRVAAAAYGQ